MDTDGDGVSNLIDLDDEIVFNNYGTSKFKNSGMKTQRDYEAQLSGIHAHLFQLILFLSFRIFLS